MRVYLRILGYLRAHGWAFAAAVAATFVFAGLDAFSFVLFIPFLRVLFAEPGASRAEGVSVGDDRPGQNPQCNTGADGGSAGYSRGGHPGDHPLHPGGLRRQERLRLPEDLSHGPGATGSDPGPEGRGLRPPPGAGHGLLRKDEDGPDPLPPDLRRGATADAGGEGAGEGGLLGLRVRGRALFRPPHLLAAHRGGLHHGTPDHGGLGAPHPEAEAERPPGPGRGGRRQQPHPGDAGGHPSGEGFFHRGVRAGSLSRPHPEVLRPVPPLREATSPGLPHHRDALGRRHRDSPLVRGPPRPDIRDPERGGVPRVPGPVPEALLPCEVPGQVPGPHPAGPGGRGADLRVSGRPRGHP